MRLKSYYSTTVEAAIRRARIEIGEEAMLVSSREAPSEARHLGRFEVVFALPDVGASPLSARKSVASSESVDPDLSEGGKGLRHVQPGRVISSEVSALRRELDRIGEAILQTGSLSIRLGGVAREPELAKLYAALRAADVPHDLAQEALMECLTRSVPSGSRMMRDVMNEALQSWVVQHVRVVGPDAASDRKKKTGETGRAVAFIGPSGAGKSTALVKLVVELGAQDRLPVKIVAFDNLRVAAWEQMRSFACVLGVAFQTAETPRALAQVLDESRGKYSVWIDTPGYGRNDQAASAEVASLLRQRQEIDVHLVLSATTKSADLYSAVQRFEVFEPRKLLFTHLDETETYGGVLSTLAQTRLPISFLSDGQQVPEDIHAASAGEVLKLIAGCVAPRLPGTVSDHAQAGRAVAGV